MPSRREPLTEISENDAMSSPGSNAPGAGRRKSGRAVRAPEKFQPAPAQPENTNGKRKRGGAGATEDDENDVDEAEEESEEDEEDSEDEEEARASRRKGKNTKKPAAKKAKVNGAASHEDAPAVRLPNRPKKTKKVAIEDTTAEGLYAAVFTSAEEVKDVATQWLRDYEEDNPASLKELINLVLKSSGCDFQVSEDDINDPDNVPTRLNDLQEEYKGENVTDYPLISKAKSTHAFRVSLTNFFQSLIETMHATSILYDEIALIENIHLWVTTMSSSYLRPFRHTATVIALAVTTGMCTVCKQQATVTSNTLHQLQGEKKKSPKNQERIKEFSKKVEQGNERLETCKNTIQDFIDTVFVHRYRDVDPKIRTDCVEALGQWIKILPETFLDPNHLRYLGWMLSDASAPTRHETVKQLEKVMKTGKDVGSTRDFIDRFRPRIVEMATQDSDVGVRVSAIDLLDLIREEGILEPDDIDTIGQLIFDSEARVRKVVVGFFADNIKDLYEAKIEELGGEEALEDVLAVEDDDYESPRAGWITLKCLAEVLSSYDADDIEGSPSQVVESADTEFINSGSSESRFTLATQALYDKIPDISTWEILAGYLLYDHSASTDSTSAGANIDQNLRASFKPSEKEEVILLEVLSASVKISLSQVDEHDKARESLRKKKLSKAEMLEAQESTARRLAGLIPQLLRKFSASPATTSAVLRLEHVLNLGVFQQLRQDGAFASLLHEITSQFSAHADQRVLTEASAAILHAKGFEDLEEITEEQVQSLWDNTIADFRKRFPKTNVMSVRGDSDTKQLTDLRNIVTRVGKLASISDPIERFESTPVVKGRASERAKLPVVDMLLECVGRGFLEESQPDIDDYEDRLVSSACQATLFYFMWKARSLQALMKNSDEIPDLDVDQIKERLDTFTGNLIRVFSSRADVDEIRLLTTGTLLDVYSLYSTFSYSKQSKDATATDKYANLQTLVYETAPEVQEELTTIFAQLEKKYAKKAHRSLEAPADDDEPEDLESEPEDDDDVTDAERKGEILTVERQLCDLSAKIVLAILAGVIDAAGPLKGKLRTRVQRNKLKLGPNFKEVIAYLDEERPKEPGLKKSHKSKAVQAAIEARKKSKILVEEEEDEEDEEDEEEPEEGTAEDLRRRELLDDEPAGDADEDVEDPEEEEDDVMGD